jgi:hypothetical protein
VRDEIRELELVYRIQYGQNYEIFTIIADHFLDIVLVDCNFHWDRLQECLHSKGFTDLIVNIEREDDEKERIRIYNKVTKEVQLDGQFYKPSVVKDNDIKIKEELKRIRDLALSDMDHFREDREKELKEWYLQFKGERRVRKNYDDFWKEKDNLYQEYVKERRNTAIKELLDFIDNQIAPKGYV